jgi:hypothetical protein
MVQSLMSSMHGSTAAGDERIKPGERQHSPQGSSQRWGSPLMMSPRMAGAAQAPRPASSHGGSETDDGSLASPESLRMVEVAREALVAAQAVSGLQEEAQCTRSGTKPSSPRSGTAPWGGLAASQVEVAPSAQGAGGKVAERDMHWWRRPWHRYCEMSRG